MKTMKVFFLALVAMLGVNNSIAQTYVYPPNSGGYSIDKYPSQTITIGVTGDVDGYGTWTSDRHGLLGSNALLNVTDPDQYTKGHSSGVTTPFNVRNIQDPSAIVITDNGDGTMTIGGIDVHFTPGGGGNNWCFDGAYTIPIPSGVNPIASGQTSYPVSGSGSKVYTIVTTDGFAGNATYALQVTANFQTPATPPTITTTSLPNATQGTAYS